jgi:hypothetical protein
MVEKEKGDEARYFRDQEADRAKAVRANMERILALDDDSSEKKELMTKMGNLYIKLNTVIFDIYIPFK